MEFIWSETDEKNYAEQDVWEALKKALADDEGICYHRYPVFSADRSRREPDILILHRYWGLYIIEVKGCTIENIEKVDGPIWFMKDWYKKKENPIIQAEDQMWAVTGKFRQERDLRKGRYDVISGHIFIALPNISSKDWNDRGFNTSPAIPSTIIFADDLPPERLSKKLENVPAEERQDPISEKQWKMAKSVLQGAPALRREPREEPIDKNSKASLLREVELQILSMDRTQLEVAQSIPPGPQRIRGLAGSGKTIVLCMKVAWMHSRYPNWNIAYTFYTRSLYGMIKSLITRFYRFWIDQDPDWEKIHILHGWGGKEQSGLYRNTAIAIGMNPRSYREAKNVFTFRENNEILGKCCLELLKSGVLIQEEYDAIIIDEAQDFHFDFYKLCHRLLKEPKRLIWAYDEIQSLESLAIPTTKEIFGTNPDGSLVVDLDGTYDDKIEKDLILMKCYRTPRPILLTAHAYGMGLLRKEGAVQFIPSRGGWEDIGYELIAGELKEGETVTIRRPKENSPHILEDLVGYENLLITKEFPDKNSEIEWIANQIYKNISEDELKPNDVVVIGIPLDWTAMNEELDQLEVKLSKLGVRTYKTGPEADKDIFRIKDHVTLTHIYKAKGNEAPVTYVIGFEKIDETDPKLIIQSRNQAFTAMTRSRGWCIVTGIQGRVTNSFDEFKRILETPGEICFVVPSEEAIQRNLDSLEYERRRKRISIGKKALKILEDQFTEDEDVKRALRTIKKKISEEERKNNTKN